MLRPPYSLDTVTVLLGHLTSGVRPYFQESRYATMHDKSSLNPTIVCYLPISCSNVLSITF